MAAFTCGVQILAKQFAKMNLFHQQTKQLLTSCVLTASSAQSTTSDYRTVERSKQADENFALAVPPPIRPQLPIIVGRKLAYPQKFAVAPQAWVENVDAVEQVKLGIVDLHPSVFATPPRLDILHQNVRWQKNYRRVRYAKTKTRAEKSGGGRKPWPQKGTGKARHGSIRSPLFKGGGVAHGPRGYKTYFYMLPYWIRIKGLTTALSVKLAQGDMHVVDNLDLPTDEPKFLQNLVEERKWGPSVLFVDDADIMPKNITIATDNIGHYNLMPVYGLNVYSMLKHDTLVLTMAAVERLEERILFHTHKLDTRCTKSFNRTPH